jgi:hypothetical protein
MFEKISNLKIWQKLLVVTSLLALPILLLLYVFVDKQNEQIELGYKEQRGLEYIAALRPVLEHVPQHRDTSVAILYGDETLRDSLDTTRKKIESDMAAVDAVDERLGKELKTSSAWQALRASWRQLQPQATTVLARDSFVRHTAVVQQTLDLIRLVGENSTLTTDQNLDAFYLSDTLIQQASSMTENLSQMRGLGAALAARGRTSPEEAGQMLYYMRLVENANGMVQRNMA